MFYLKNPQGRIIDFDSMDEFNRWKKNQGFLEPSQDEIVSFISDRSRFIESMKNRATHEADYQSGLYFLTVSSGGADGYSTSSVHMMNELNMLGLPCSTQYKGQRIGILYHNPYSLVSMESDYRILFTMFESDKLPDDWREYLDIADMIIVPSRWVQSIFEKFGYKTIVVPLGYNSSQFEYVDRQPKAENRQIYTFLHYNGFNLRKGFREVLKAFTEEFARDEPVRLVIKSTLDKMPIPLLKSEYPNIDVILGKKDEVELREIIENADCFVYPSRGEGFGIPPLECMATGMPVIVPNAHGITEYFNPDFMYEVKVAETCPAIYSRYKNQDVGNMVICDVDHLRSQMRYVYEHQSEAREKGKKASEHVKQWTYKKTAEQIQRIFEQVMKSPIKERAIQNVLTFESVK